MCTRRRVASFAGQQPPFLSFRARLVPLLGRRYKDSWSMTSAMWCSTIGHAAELIDLLQLHTGWMEIGWHMVAN